MLLKLTSDDDEEKLCDSIDWAAQEIPLYKQCMNCNTKTGMLKVRFEQFDLIELSHRQP